MEESDNGTLVGEIQKNAREFVRVHTREYKGYDLVDVRLWYEAGHEDIRPTAKGFSLRRELVPELLEILQGVAVEEGRAAA